MVIKIPGLSHEVITQMIHGINYVIISFRGDELAKAQILSHSEAGILDSLIRCVKEANIDHYAPNTILTEVAKKLINKSDFYHSTAITQKDEVKFTQQSITHKKEEEKSTIMKEIIGISTSLQKNFHLIKTQLDNLEKGIDQIKIRFDNLESKVLNNENQ